MASPPPKRRRKTMNPFLDLEAAVENDEDAADAEEDSQSGFINDEAEEEGDEVQVGRGEELDDQVDAVRQLFSAILSSDDHTGKYFCEEEPHAALLHQFIRHGVIHDIVHRNELNFQADTETILSQEISVRRPAWAEIAHTNSVVASALDTWDGDNLYRRIQDDDKLYEVRCEVGIGIWSSYIFLHPI